MISAVRGTATGIATAVTIANPGSGGAAPAPATDGVTTGMPRGAATQVGSTAAVTTSGSVTTSVAAMATAAATTGTTGTNRGAGIAISTGTSAAVTVRRVSAPPGGTGRNIHTVAATMSVAAVMIADPGKHATISANRVTSIPSNRTR